MLERIEQVRAPGEDPRRTPILSLQHLSIGYEEAESPVIKDIEFSLHEGESVLFMGPSGCGKSTLAMLCAHLIPRSVEAEVSGTIWYSPQVSEPGQVGYVFQDPDSQFCMLTTDDEIAFGMENQVIAPRDMPDRIVAALERAGLSVSIHDPAATFSGGMKQKLAIASALVLEPSMLVFDEPTANLDPLSTRQVFDQIARMHDAGQTMIVIEHKFDALLPIMDRVVLFDRNGRIHRDGPTHKVIKQEWDWMLNEGIVAAWKHNPFNPPLQLTPQGMTGPSMTTDNPVGSAATSGKQAYELQNVCIQYGSHHVFEDLSLTIPQGMIVAIVGPNGSGKSTLLQALAGLRKPSKGMVKLLDRPMRKWPVRERFQAIAYSFQNPEFQFIYERVGDELANRIVGDQVPESILELLRQFGLDGLDQHSPFALSQGQKRRLSVAAMMKDAHDIYLFDEPTFGQDAKTQLAIMERMKFLHEQGKTIVLTTHDMDLVRRYAQMVIVVTDGQVIFQGGPSALFERSDILRAAHLLDDVTALYQPVISARDSEAAAQGIRDRRSPIQHLNAAWLFLAMFSASVISLFAHTLWQASAELALPLLVMMILGWMTPWRILKLISPFLVFYVLYLWSFVANAAVPAGVQTFNILWYHLSYYGLHEGLILSIRMLGSVLFGILFITKIDFTDFMVALCKTFHVPPKFAYGTMAGLRVVPLFSSQWTILRQARQIRGRDNRSPWLLPVTYGLPLLSQGIRMSERVAIAMEARGFHGRVTEAAQYRTFYRSVAVRWWDYAVTTAIILLAIIGAVL